LEKAALLLKPSARYQEALSSTTTRVQEPQPYEYKADKAKGSCICG
jgi:hypothetical protein